MRASYLPFELGHLDFFEPRDDFENLRRDMGENLQNPSISLVTVTLAKQILMIAGCTKFRAGVGEVWLLLDKCYERNKIRMVAATKELMMECLVKELGYYRLQMAIDANIPERKRWAEFLGFEKEGLMKSYDTTGADHFLYARLF